MKLKKLLPFLLAAIMTISVLPAFEIVANAMWIYVEVNIRRW